MAIETKTAEASTGGKGASLPDKFHNASFINEYGKLETLRAIRRSTPFSIILANVAGFEGALSRHKNLKMPAAAHKVAAAIISSGRSSDVVGMTGDNQIVIVMPETDYFTSLALVRKLSDATDAMLRDGVIDCAVTYALSTFPRDGKTYDELLRTANCRFAERKSSLWDKLGLDGKLFWEILEGLLNRGYKGFDNSCFDAGAGFELTEFIMDQINDLIVKEIKRSPHRKAVAYFSASRIAASFPVVKGLASAGALEAKIYIAGEGDGEIHDMKNASLILLDDPRFKDTFFTLFLDENSGYALVCKENWGATFSCFHTSDPCMVEGLINKLYKEYSLHEHPG